VPDAIVTATNRDTTARRSTLGDATGNFTLVNLEPGTYEITVEAKGFSRALFTNLGLESRQTMRINATLTVASQTETVNVQASADAVITTDTSGIANAKQGKELLDLPIAIASRGAGSTSTISTLTTQAGVQTDSSGNLSVAGAKPSMLSVSVDGISSVSPRSSALPSPAARARAVQHRLERVALRRQCRIRTGRLEEPRPAVAFDDRAEQARVRLRGARPHAHLARLQRSAHIDPCDAQPATVERLPLRALAGVGNDLADPALQICFDTAALPGAEVKHRHLSWSAWTGNRRLRDPHCRVRRNLLPTCRQRERQTIEIHMRAGGCRSSAASKAKTRGRDEQRNGTKSHATFLILRDRSG
jgi:hypothetical protein